MNNNGVFIQEQKDLEENVWDVMIYKQRAIKIQKEINEILN